MISFSDHRCVGVNCEKKNSCLRHIKLNDVDHGACWEWRCCKQGKTDKIIFEEVEYESRKQNTLQEGV